MFGGLSYNSFISSNGRRFRKRVINLSIVSLKARFKVSYATYKIGCVKSEQ